MGKLFGTDGIRGIVNKELTCDLTFKVGIEATRVLTCKNNKHPKILIAKDSRISSDMLESALCAGICSIGGEAILLGVVPTPAVAFLVKKYNADAGIMISASHNSFEFNGIKIFSKDGYKLSDELENLIESRILGNSLEMEDLALGSEIGKVTKCNNASQDYINHLRDAVKIQKSKLKILIDCANGAASYTAKELFKNLNADIIFNSPNGININKDCGSTSIEKLSSQVVEKGYDIGIAFDGDADRCQAVDECGNIIDGDTILGICALDMKSNESLSSSTLVGTIMSNMGLKKFCQENNIHFIETKVGDRYVLEEMVKGSYSLGGEQSGHIIFGNHSTTGDGQLTALNLLKILINSGKKASELNNMIKKFPQKSENILINLNQKGMLKSNGYLLEYFDSLKENIGDEGRIVVRESGTEPKIRIMVEHKDEKKLNEIINELSRVIRESFKKTIEKEIKVL